MNRRQALRILGGLGISTTVGSACLWDTDTLREEIAVRPTMWDLLLGQFPHHGDAYYQARIARLEKAGELDVASLNDLAVAHVRLKEFKPAWKALEAARLIKPDHYETLSNMGVTAKKQGDFQKGAEYIAKALELKPEGHMGLGDWYLKALRWRAKNEHSTKENPPAKNFLGVAYPESFSDSDYGSDHDKPAKAPTLEDRYEQLIRNDQSFADGFVTVGDALTFRGDLNLSFFAYTRALMLDHQNPGEVSRRRLTYLKYFETFLSNERNLRGDTHQKAAIKNAEEKINGGLAWLEQFKAVETDLLNENADERLVKFEDVETEMERRGIHRIYLE
ncbi:MAG: hypothetical protein NWS16_07635 [Akkermansiaceae bacterium]|jgi:tetratricopeptide (TPR) repeat protein|nr:hypothetical protein [Akkermansiaceae bacterium]